jgi:hypothetical protein
MKRIFLVLGFIALCLFLYWYSTKRTKEEKVLVFDYQHDHKPVPEKGRQIIFKHF